MSSLSIGLSEYFFVLGGNCMRPERTQTGMSLYRPPYISFHSFTWDWPEKII